MYTYVHAIDVWTVSSYENVFRDAEKPTSATNKFDLTMVKNEAESFQVLLKNNEDFNIKEIVFSNLKSGKNIISKKNLSYNFVEYVYMRGNSVHQSPETLIRTGEGWYPDPLSNEKTIAVKANEVQPVWITVSIPKNSAPGLYKGNIHIKTSAGDYTTEVTVRVADIMIPDANKANFRFMHHQQIAGTWYYDATPGNHPQDVIYQIYNHKRWTPKWWALVEDMAEKMKASRVNVLFVNSQQLLLDGGTTLDNGVYTFNWSRFDEYIQFFLDRGGINALEGLHFGSTIGEVGITYYSYILKRNDKGVMCSTNTTPMNADCKLFYTQYIPALYKHLKDKGWLNMWIQHIGDEAVSELQHTQYSYYMNILKTSAPDMQCGDPTYTLKSAQVAVGKGATVTTPIEDLYEKYQSSFDSLRTEGVTIYAYNCCLPGHSWLNRLIDKPVWNQRSLGWLSFKWGIKGWLHWGWNFWVHWYDDKMHTVDDEGFKGDHYSVYPDVKNNKIKSSIRMDAIRDMCEDYELLYLLGQKDRELALQLVDEIAVNASGDYTKDIDKMIAIRKRLIDACEAYK